MLQGGLLVLRMGRVVARFGDLHPEFGKIEFLEIAGGHEGAHPFEVRRSENVSRGEIGDGILTRLQPGFDVGAGKFSGGVRMAG